VECWPAVYVAHLATSARTPRDEWWAAGTAPLLVVQGLDDEAAPPSNGYALRAELGDRVRVVDIPRAGHFLVLEQPEAVLEAVTKFIRASQRTRNRSNKQVRNVSCCNCSRQKVAHFPRSLRCGDRVRLQSYFCRASVVGFMPVHDPQQPTLACVDRAAAIVRAPCSRSSDTLIRS